MLPCPTCGANIDARSHELAVAACGRCGGLFEWPLAPAPVPSVDRPARIVVERGDGKVQAIRWRVDRASAMAAVVVVAGLLVVGAQSPWLALSSLFPLGAAFWQPLQRALGTRIALGPVIAIRQAFETRVRVAAASIRQPFVRRVDRGQLSDRYDLCAIQTDGTVVTLVEGLSSSVEAQFVERELETALGIDDAAVPGELEGRAFWVNEASPPRPLRLLCPACSTVLKASDVQLWKGQAVCAGCGNGMLLGGPAAAGLRTLVMLPAASVVVDRSPNAFALDAPFRPHARAPAGPPVRRSALSVGREVVSACCVAIVFGQLLLAPADRSDRILAGVMLLVSLAQFFAVWVDSRIRVHIRGEDGTLHVRVGPAWMRSVRAIPIHEIAQVFVREQPFSLVMDSKAFVQICVLDRNGRILPLVGWMRDLREARSIEEELERILGIEDAPVAGEVEGKTPRQLAGAPALPDSGNLSLPDALMGGELSDPPAAGALSKADERARRR